MYDWNVVAWFRDGENPPAEKSRAKAAKYPASLETQYRSGGLLEIDEEPSPPNSSENKTGFFLANTATSNWTALTERSFIYYPTLISDCGCSLRRRTARADQRIPLVDFRLIDRFAQNQPWATVQPVGQLSKQEATRTYRGSCHVYKTRWIEGPSTLDENKKKGRKKEKIMSHAIVLCVCAPKQHSCDGAATSRGCLSRRCQLRIWTRLERSP